MTQLNNLETAELLIRMGLKNHLASASDKLIYRMAEEALAQKMEAEQVPPESQMAEDAAAASADLIQEAEEMLKDQQISRERLKEIAEAAFPLVERQVVMMFGS
jgi:CO/xanthine dehydrogenase FAD-binding subunit